MLSSRRSNQKAKYCTKNKDFIRSVQFFLFQGMVFLGVSGCGDHLEVFDVSAFESEEADLSKFYWFRWKGLI